MGAAEVVRRAGGAVRWGDLRRAGQSRWAIDAAVRSGALLRPARGTLATPGCSADVVQAAARCASLACVSAIADQGLDLLRAPRQPHLTGPATRPGPGVTWHRGRSDGPRLPAARAAAQMLTCRPAAECLVALDGVLRRDFATRAEIAGQLPANVRGPARRLLAQADGRAESVLESLVRFHLLRAGIPDIELQAAIPGLGHVDLLLGGWLVLEADGLEGHSDPVAFAEDRRRTTVAAEQGFITIRIGWRQISERPAETVAIVQRVLDRGPWDRPSLRDEHPDTAW